MADTAPTPAALIEQLRTELGEPGKPLSDDRLAELVGVPTRQQVIDWRKHGKGMSRKYAERFSEISQQTSRPHPPEAFLPTRSAATAALEARVAQLEGRIEELVQGHESLAVQVEVHSAQLATLETAGASRGDAPNAPEPQQPERRSG